MLSSYGELDISRSSSFSDPVLGRRVSPLLQEKLVYLGVENVYSHVPEIVERILGISVSQSCVYRCCQSAADSLEPSSLLSAGAELSSSYEREGSQVYGMIDGSMVFLDDGWQEVKVGRVFGVESSSKVPGRGNTEKVMSSSEYVAHRGSHTDFALKFEELLPVETASPVVFVTDGARWISQWLSSRYPSAVQILDFYHVVEKLSGAYHSSGRASSGCGAWLSVQKEHLLSSSIDAVCQSVLELGLDDETEDKLLNYIENNRYRMDYRSYRERNFYIGSGAIESAHRTLLQERMKRSGQRWAEQGADNMIDLRVALKSGKFHLVRNIYSRKIAA